MPRGLQNVGWPERGKLLRSKSKLEEQVPCMYRTYTYPENLIFLKKLVGHLLLFSCCHVWLLVIPWTAAYQGSLSFTISRSLLKLLSIELMMPSNHRLLLPPFLLPSIFPSVRGFSNELGFHIRWLKYWSFSFSISPSNEYSGLISFRIDWFDLCAVQGTLKNPLQHHNSKASILQCSAFFMVQLSQPYMTTGNTIALTKGIFVAVYICHSL